MAPKRKARDTDTIPDEDVPTATATAKKAKGAVWEEHDTLFYKTYGNPAPNGKIASFDFDDTLSKPKSGKKFAVDASDWSFWAPSVLTELKRLHSEGYKLVIFSNQKGISTERKKTSNGPKERGILGRFDNFVAATGLDFQVVVGSDDDQFRKPSTSGLEYFEEHLNGGIKIDRATSFYCGDAAGRVAGWKAGAKKDFACSDREFALNAGIKFITPDELFLKDKTAASAAFEHDFDPKTIDMNQPLFTPTTTPLIATSSELIIMVGFPGSGKSSFVQKNLEPHGYVRVNMDELKTPAKCIKMVEQSLKDKKKVVLDNTSPDIATRKTYIGIAKEHDVPVRIFHMNISKEQAQHMNYFRMKTLGIRRVPSVAYNMYKSKYQEPKLNEGVKEIKQINFVPSFANEQEKALFLKFT